MKIKYFAPFASVFIAGALLLAAIFAYFSSSLGWFSENRTANVSGLSLTVKGIPETEEYFKVNGVKVDETTDVFREMTPGETRTIDLYIHNLSDKSINLLLSMSAPSAETDTAYVEDGLYHYFGSQIRLNSVKNGETDVLTLTGANKYLLPLDDTLYTDGLQPTGIEDEYDFTGAAPKQIGSKVTLAAGEELTLTFEFEFVDNGELQNAYISFADTSSDDEQKASMILSRKLICYYAFNE
jgi:hypothetical protein